MSLINQVLQDLEARHAINEQALLPNDVRPLPIERSSAAPKVLLGGVVLAVLTMGAYWWAQVRSNAEEYPRPSSQVIKRTPVVAPQPPVVAPVQISAPVQTPQPEISYASTAPVEVKKSQTKPVSSAVPDEVQRQLFGLKVATVLSQMPQTPQTPVPPTTVPEVVPVNTAPSLPAPAVAKSKTNANTNTGPVVINKQVRLATANDRAENEYRKAMGALNQGQIEDAITGLRAALHEDATHGNARQALAVILIEQGQLEAAQSVLQEGLAQNSAQPEMAIKLARIQVERGDIKGASETLQRSAATGANSAGYRAFSAGVLQRLGDHPAAINEYQAALRLSPNTNIWWMGLGISLDADGKRVEARDAFQKARTGNGLSPDLDRFVEQKLRQLQ